MIVAVLALAVSAAQAGLSDVTVGNVTTTSFAVCWEAGAGSGADVEVYAGGVEITDSVEIEAQYLQADRREVASTPQTRQAARELQAAMNGRGVFLVRISGLDPSTDYEVRAIETAGGGTLDASGLLPVTTAARAAFIAEARQLVVDLAGAAASLGELPGVIVRLDHAGSRYPLFSVVGDGMASDRAYFDLSAFLDAAGTAGLALSSGDTLALTISFRGAGDIDGEFTGNEIAYTGEARAAESSVASFTGTVQSITLVAVPERPTALAGRPFAVALRANLAGGTPSSGFNRPLVLTSPAIPSGSLESEPLVGGVLDGQALVLGSPGVQTVVVADPLGGSITEFSVEVLEYNYNNFRIHYYGNTTDPAGGKDENSDGDPYDNTLEFAFGLDPSASDKALVLGPGPTLVKPGGPMTTIKIDADGVDFRVTFLRPKNYQSLGIVYTPQFGSGLSHWFAVTAPPTVIEDLGVMELVTVPYPYFTPEARRSRFFRINVTIP